MGSEMCIRDRNDVVAFQATVNNAISSALKASGLTPTNDVSNNNESTINCIHCDKGGHTMDSCFLKKRHESGNTDNTDTEKIGQKFLLQLMLTLQQPLNHTMIKFINGVTSVFCGSFTMQ